MNSSIKLKNNIPFARNAEFIERDEAFKLLSLALATRNIIEVAGSGKTQLIIEYAYRNLNSYELIWWIRGNNHQLCEDDYIELAKPLGLRLPDFTMPSDICYAIKNQLEQTRGWLLIFDGVNDTDIIYNLLPSNNEGEIIICLESKKCENENYTINIEAWKRNESIDYIINSIKADIKNSNLISDELNDDPLLISIFCSFIRQSKVSIHEALNALNQNEDDKLEALWYMVSTFLQKTDPEVLICAKLISLFQNQDLPIEALTAYSSETLKLLRAYNLIQESNEWIYMNSRLKRCINKSTSSDEKNTLVMKAIMHFDSQFSDEIDEEEFIDAKTIQPALLVAELAYSKGIAKEAAARIFNEAGTYLRDRGSLDESRKAAVKAVEIATVVLGEFDSCTAIYVSNLATVICDMGDLHTAKTFFERALDIDKHIYGEHHPSLAHRLSNLGKVARDLGDFTDAKKCFEQAIDITSKAHGDLHPSVAQCVSNLAYTLEIMGDAEEAAKQYELALQITEAAYGPKHPSIAIRTNDLGELIRDNGDVRGAYTQLLKALRTDEAVYGFNNPAVAIRLCNLAWVAEELGEIEEAKDYLERALEIDKKAYGESSPETAVRYYNLGYIISNLGDMKTAKKHYEKALQIDEAAFGLNHSKVAIRLNCLAGILEEMGEVNTARLYYARAMNIFKDTLGLEHPFTIVATKNFEEVR